MIILAVWFCVGEATAEDIVVRSSRQPEGPIMLGQQMRLFIDVLFPGVMRHPPRVAEPSVPGAQVLRFETQATNISEPVGAVDYVGQRFEFDLYPRRAGPLKIPPLEVTLLDEAGGSIGTRTSPGLALEASVPPGLDPSAPIVAASAVALTEVWQPQSHEFQVGDALVRLVTRSAVDVPGLALAPLDFSAVDGVRVYSDAPVIADATDRGQVTGRRTDRVTYVFEKSGHFTLPVLMQPWWDLESHSMHVLTLSALTIDVVGAAAPAGHSQLWIGVWVAGGLALLVIILLGRPIAARRWGALHAGDRAKERAAFRDLQIACRTVDAHATYRAWQGWMRRLREPAVAADGASALQRALFGGQVWTRHEADRLLEAAQAIRRHPSPQERNSATLPLLNPIRDINP